MAQNGFTARGGDRGSTHRYKRNPDESISTAVTLAVTDALERDIESLQPLGEVLDVDALDSLTSSATGTVAVEFEYEGCLVTVRRGSEILVTLST